MQKLPVIQYIIQSFYFFWVADWLITPGINTVLHPFALLVRTMSIISLAITNGSLFAIQLAPTCVILMSGRSSFNVLGEAIQ